MKRKEGKEREESPAEEGREIVPLLPALQAELQEALYLQARKMSCRVRHTSRENAIKVKNAIIGIHLSARIGRKVRAAEVRIAHSCIAIRALLLRLRRSQKNHLKTRATDPHRQKRKPQKPKRRRRKRKNLPQEELREQVSRSLEVQS